MLIHFRRSTKFWLVCDIDSMAGNTIQLAKARPMLASGPAKDTHMLWLRLK